MNEHRLIQAKSIEKPFIFQPPFSSFSFIENRYGDDCDSIRRIFSLARSKETKFFIIEHIEPSGIIQDENEEIQDYFADYRNSGLERISFWANDTNPEQISSFHDENCHGYAILKKDTIPSRNFSEWHVFEALIKKYDHYHNCVPNPFLCKVNLVGKELSLEGVLYAQQNQLNKKCAQVALQSLITRILNQSVPYRKLNEIASRVNPDFHPTRNGLNVKQIRAILEEFGIQYRDFVYDKTRPEEFKDYPYQKFIYSGVESGGGALLGFSLSGPAIASESLDGHIIPFFGHTFDKDTWAPDADKFYFKIGEELKYVPSENWTSSFLGHDDNFGPNFSVPRLYIPQEQVDYVVELLMPGINYNGSQAEVISLQYLYSVLQWINDKENDLALSDNRWILRLAKNVETQQIVLRAISKDKSTYITHLKTQEDWEGNVEFDTNITMLEDLPDHLWIVEISIPQLFPANERKLGEIVLNGHINFEEGETGEESLVFVRLPGLYFLPLVDTYGSPDFLSIPSNINTHLRVIS